MNYYYIDTLRNNYRALADLPGAFLISCRYCTFCPADTPNFGPRHIPGNVENSTANEYAEGNVPIKAEDWQKLEPWHLLCLVVADRSDTMDLWTTARRFAGTPRLISEMEATRLRLRRERENERAKNQSSD